jgi:hypothetical protein
MDLETAYGEFMAELLFEAEASGDLQHDAFFNLYAAVASVNGDTIDLEYTPARREGGRAPYQIDGFALDVERATLHVAVCDFRPDIELPTLNAAQIDNSMKRLRNFVEQAVDPSFINELADTSFAFQAAYPIYTQPAAIKRIRAVLFSNARMSTRRPPQVAEEIIGRPAVYNVLDFARYAEIMRSKSNPEPIEIDITAIAGAPVPCLEASGDSGDYRSFLIALPGNLLSEIYALYGARLLEQNVRTFLQAKTKVNKGIIQTLRETPEMFFAYNNGLTATASDVTLARLPDGQLAISMIRDLQIVNGGQTTASILYAKDQAKADLEHVHVQMKLSVVQPERIETVVPKISRFANTQNRITEADFFSSHPFHLAMEQISRRMAAPPRPGSLVGSKYFYERARGQYRDAMAYLTPAERKRRELEFPRDQLIDKTDLAKFAVTFEPRPDVVSRHAQKCFMYFADEIARHWKRAQTDLNDAWYRQMCAKALLFRWTDRMINTSEWYKADRGYKSQTVAYTLGWLVNQAKARGKAGLNLQLVWNAQDVPDELAGIIIELAPQVARALRDAPETMRNVGEYSKTEACWTKISEMEFLVTELPDALLQDVDDARDDRKDAAAVRKIDLEIGFDELLVNLAPKAELIKATAAQRQLLSPKSSAALDRLARYDFTGVSSERRALKNLFERLHEQGAPVTEI